ncbi:KICSTOR complex protein kaptin-like isoform X2 [Ornithodoros turicata]|uniref:KICSTOR complex protein kaptin-like isoform X2 n=1 Tax=Ornithodoros turicata TaxID=34597 RepID=UPI0031389E9B
MGLNRNNTVEAVEAMEGVRKRMTEVHFSGLPSQSNIYGMTTLTMGWDVNSVLVSCLQRNVFCIEYTRSARNVMVPSTREVQFTYLPEGADVVAMDAFSRPLGNSLDVIIGIAFVRSGENQPSKQYLNIYSQGEPGTGVDLDKIAQGCLHLELDYIPYQLTHSQLFSDEQAGRETVFLVSGCDRKIHVFREDESHQSYSEVPVEDHFPEFVDIPDVVLSMALKYADDDRKRISAFCCEGGLVRVAVTELQRGGMFLCTQDKIFKDSVVKPIPEFLTKVGIAKREGSGEEPIHLLVGNTLGPSLVYRDILQQGLDKCAVLPHSEHFDSVTCGCIADVDMDGTHEVVLGTYGQEVLVFKLEDERYVPLWQQTVSHPVLSLRYLDITGDGLRELVVLSTKGLHILQHDLQETAEVCMERIRKLCRLQR